MTADPPRPGPEPALPPDFDDLYRADWHAIVALGWSLTGSRSAAEELAQDAFLDAYRRWDHVGGLDKPGAWVRRAVANRAVSHRRHLRVVQVGNEKLASAARSVSGTGDDGHDPEFWSAVRALPERQAQCVALHYLEDRAVDDIADLLEMRPSTVRVHLSRGRRALARTLGLTPTSEEDA